MAKEKPGIMMYWEMFDVLESLMDGQTKTMLRAIRSYSQYGEVPDFANDALLATLWMLVKPKIDADSDRYEKIRKQRTDAINARWDRERAKEHSENGSIQPYTNEYEDIRNIPTTSSTAPSSTTAAPSTVSPPTETTGVKGYKGLTFASQSSTAENSTIEERRRLMIATLRATGEGAGA